MTEMWGQGDFKHKGTTGKVEPSKQLLAEENLNFRCLSQKLLMSMIYHNQT